MTASLKQRLMHAPAILAPGAYDALSALLIQQAGFEAIYVSGASIAYTQLGRPDLGLVAMDHLGEIVGHIAERVHLPLIVDADTGFGNALNVARTVKRLERNGASAIQLEDQQFPKRCGHLDGKTLVGAHLKAAGSSQSSAQQMTDLKGVNQRIGLDAMLELAARYEDRATQLTTGRTAE